MEVDKTPENEIDKTPDEVMYWGEGYDDGRINVMLYNRANCPGCEFGFSFGDKNWGKDTCPRCGKGLIWNLEDF